MMWNWKPNLCKYWTGQIFKISTFGN